MDARIFCTLTFVCGILCHRLSPVFCLSLVTVWALLLLWHPKLRTGWILILSLTCLAAGLGRALLDDSGEAFETVSGGLTITGSISEPPRKWGRSSVFFFKVDTINGEWVTDPCKLLVSWSQCEQTLAPGDRWSLSGRFSRGETAAYPGAFDLTHWLWSQGAVGRLSLNRFSSFHFIGPPVGHTPHQLAYRARESMMRKLQKISDPDAAALVAGVVFGETQSLPKELQEQFRRTGTSHLLAASGMNVALLAGLVLFAGKACGYGAWRVAPWAVPLVVSYAFLAGCGPSITRAAIGTSMALIAISLGRRSTAWNSLALSTWILLLWDPRQVYDVGFQLSAIAVIGLIGSPKVAKTRSAVVKSLVLTISVTMVALPIFWCTFKELSTTVLLANLLLGPIVEALFPLGLIASVVEFKPLLIVLNILAQISLFLVGRLSHWGDPILLTSPTLISWLLLLAGLYLWLTGKTWPIRGGAILLIGAALVYNIWQSRQPQCGPDELIIRKSGRHKPIYWLSSGGEELLVLTEAWQEKRAKTMMRDLGCSRTPQILLLKERPFQLQWKNVSWQVVGPLLPEAMFFKLHLKNDRYSVQTFGE